MKQTTFSRCLLTEHRVFFGLKHLTEKVTALTGVRVVVDHKEIVFLPYQDFIFHQKHTEPSFLYVIFSLSSI